jgi:hypothetical protein
LVGKKINLEASLARREVEENHLQYSRDYGLKEWEKPMLKK